jgi:hypothetical protein
MIEIWSIRYLGAIDLPSRSLKGKRVGSGRLSTAGRLITMLFLAQLCGNEWRIVTSLYAPGRAKNARPSLRPYVPSIGGGHPRLRPQQLVVFAVLTLTMRINV